MLVGWNRHVEGPRGEMVLSGALTQYAPWPTRLSFWVLAALLALLLAAARFLPRDAGATGGGHWRPRAPSIPKPVRAAFGLASMAMMTAYTHGVLVPSFGGQVAYDLIGTRNTLAGGAVLSLFAIVFGATSFARANDLSRRTGAAHRRWASRNPSVGVSEGRSSTDLLTPQGGGR